MYRTASTLEDLDILDELHSYDSVGHAMDGSLFWGMDNQYRDTDLYVIMIDDIEKDEIIKMIKSTGYSAYLEFESEEDETGFSKIEIIKIP